MNDPLSPKGLTPLERQRLRLSLDAQREAKERVVTAFFIVAGVAIVSAAVWAILQFIR